MIPQLDLYKELYKRGNYTIQVETPWGKHEKQEEALKLLNDNAISFLGYGGSARCHTYDTLVLTNNGHIPIGKIKEGDTVLTYNEKTKQREYNKVLKKYSFYCAEPPKMIKFVNGITCTEDHELLFKGEWTKAIELRRRAMERGRRPLLHFNNGTISNIKLSKLSKVKTNETFIDSRLRKDFNINKWENKTYKNTSSSSSGIYTKSRKQATSKPYRFSERQQQSDKPRVVDRLRECYSFGKSRKIQYVQEGASTACELFKNRRRQRESSTYGVRCSRNKNKVQSWGLYSSNVSGRIRGKIKYNKRRYTQKELESREITLEEFTGSELITYNGIIYDLHVENNHNYVVSESNIITHNSGKSWVECEWLTMQCLCYDGVGYGLARKELKTLKRTTLLTLFKVFNKYNLQKDKDYNYNQQESIITFYNGSQIFLIDTAYKPSDPLNTRFGGYELTGCVIDESNETNYDVIEILAGRCGFRLNDHYNISSTVLEAFNPDKGHVYNRYYLPHRDNKETEETKFVKALPSDNPDPQVKTWLDTQIKTSSEITIQRLVYGNFDYDSSLDKLILGNALNDLFSNSFIKPIGHKYLTADIARMGKDATVIRVWHGLRVLERLELNKTLVTETASFIKSICQKYEISMSRCLVDEDGVGGGVRDILNCMGFVANSRPLGKTNYANLKSQCGWKIAELINDRSVYDNITDTTLLEKVKQELDWLREKDIDKDGKLMLVSKDIIKQAIRRSPDDLDTYIMRGYFEIGQKI